MMASEYKKAMNERGEEPYTTDKSEKSDSQKHLSDWTEEKWQTSEGNAEAKRADGSEQRYLPKKAWDKLSDEEKKETNDKKLEGGMKGDQVDYGSLFYMLKLTPNILQYVPNTDAATQARKDADADNGINNSNKRKLHSEEGGDTSLTEIRTKRGAKHKCTEEEDASESDSDDVSDEPSAKTTKGNDGEKRTLRKGMKAKSRGKGEDEDEEEEEYGKSGTPTRLPKEGQKVHWKAPTGWCEGVVIEIIYAEKIVNGIHAKASKDEPRIVLESAKSGKRAVHRPQAVYFNA
ncbi:hypothetical protein EW145_g188 [Phellinidium pouzarii]|uniref:Hypervirulence associated protein TUDOR domain-containing protein n=1 Tax=Phellinidium pouzarii TaxID=167371 RepID=A0A4S4LJG9_9AGAM|nr:hypothetical protein EW145_g188 [Phellinidium pouzarii]